MVKDQPEQVADLPLDADTESRILDAANSVFMRRGTTGARVAESGDAGCRVHHGENDTAENIAEHVRVLRHHELSRFVLRLVDAGGIWIRHVIGV